MSQTIYERNPADANVIDASLKNSKNMPFWIDDVGPQQPFAPLSGKLNVDLAIVGGGFLGLWTAILAKERNPQCKIALIEAHKIGWAASGRNGGFCEASLTHGEAVAERRWPEEAQQLDRLGRANLDEIEATLKRCNIDCDFERTGVLEVAVEPHQIESLQGEGYLNAEQVRAELDSPTFLAGNWDRDCTAMIHPGKLVMGLKNTAAKLGVQLFEGSPATGLNSSGQAMEIHTASGTLVAERVVLATNVFPSLLKRYRFHTVPVWDYALMTEPLSEAQLKSIGWQNRAGVADLGNQFHYYRITKSNRILFGGYDAIYNFGGKVDMKHEERPESFRLLASHFFTTFPQLTDIQFSHRWGGAIDTCTRLCAFFTEAYDGRVAYAAGFTGLGVGATRFAANVLLDKVYGLDTERTRLRMVREVPLPFPPEPLAFATIRATQRSLAKADRNQGKRDLLLRALDSVGLGFDS